MPRIRTLVLDPTTPVADAWRALAHGVANWCDEQGVALRDTMILVPFAQLLEPARRAFAGRGGWQPRIETTLTWAASLGPPPPPVAGSLSGSAVLDSLTAAQWLRERAGLAGWERADPRGFDQAVAATLASARALHQAAHELAPECRDEFWARAAEACPPLPAGAPGALERALAGLAIEWARLSQPAATERLFAARPGALVWLDAGGASVQPPQLAACGAFPALCVDADPPPERALDTAAQADTAWLMVLDGIEAEARAVAGAVIESLNAGRLPVALIALDRSLMRRVRALLERRGVALADETGWALSTTRAAAAVMALLGAARRGAGADDWLAALKAWPASHAAPPELLQLERAWRAQRPIEDPGAAHLWARAQAAVAPLAAASGDLRTLHGWLQTLRRALDDCGLAASLADDPAGRQVLAALHLQGGDDPALDAALRAERLDAAGFRAWVDRTLERGHFAPPAASDAEVVLTPLARAVLRPFGAAVVGGADARHLGASGPHEGLIPEAAARTLGLPTPATSLERERLALAQLMRLPHVTFVRRRREGSEPLAASPALEAIALARQRAGRPVWPEAAAPQQAVAVAAAPVVRPAPAAPHALPARLSASTVETLRTCPYRFFVRSVLRLREDEELDEAVDKRDYGNWLHAVLDHFHRGRPADGDDAAALRRSADAVSAQSGLPAARLLPYRIGFEWLLPAYLDWLHERERHGVVWQDGEFDRSCAPAELGGTQLHGRIDRLDRAPHGLSVVDYKTGSIAKLRSQLRDPMEDTQLAFYALLLEAERRDGESFEALYLALDDAGAPRELAHPEVVETARVLLHGLAEDLRRLRAGAGLPALGEGAVCGYCESRGLCRRDHWSATG